MNTTMYVPSSRNLLYCLFSTGEIEETSKKTILDRIKLLEKLE
jgi:hypothetical protein